MQHGCFELAYVHVRVHYNHSKSSTYITDKERSISWFTLSFVRALS
jgi:hypothetical protein